MAKQNGHKPQRFRVPPKRTATLKFTDGDYEGAEVVCSLDASSGIVVDFQDLASKSSEELDTVLRKFGRFYLLEWNLEDNDGEAMPATAEGMSSAPLAFTMAMISAWCDAVKGTSDPLGTESNDGSMLPEAMTRMAT